MIVLLVFMYIFAFKIYSSIDSSILVGAILSIRLLFNKKYSKIFISYLKSQYFKRLAVIACLIIIFSLATIYGNGSSDYSYVKTFVHFLISLFIGLELFCYLDYKGCSDKTVKYIIIAYIIQTVFQWMCFMIPSFSTLFNPFRSQYMNDRVTGYAGYRGIALSSSGFFSLAASYAIVFFLYFTKYNSISKKSLLYYFLFLVLITGTFFAGRTGYIGLIFVFLLLFRFRISKSIKRSTIKKIYVVILCVIIGGATLSWASKNSKFTYLFGYTFEVIDNFINGNGLSSTSTNRLIDMFDIYISPKTYIFGDGKYIVPRGIYNFYYRGVDIGYYRKILFFGIPGLILSIMLELSIFGKNINNKENILLIFLLFILEIKGEIIGLGIICNSILILYSLQSNKINSDKEESEDKEYGKDNCVDVCI